MKINLLCEPPHNHFVAGSARACLKAELVAAEEPSGLPTARGFVRCDPAVGSIGPASQGRVRPRQGDGKAVAGGRIREWVFRRPGLPAQP